jgi:hypothetical protein
VVGKGFVVVGGAVVGTGLVGAVVVEVTGGLSGGIGVSGSQAASSGSSSSPISGRRYVRERVMRRRTTLAPWV